MSDLDLLNFLPQELHSITYTVAVDVFRRLLLPDGRLTDGVLCVAGALSGPEEVNSTADLDRKPGQAQAVAAAKLSVRL